MKLEDLRIYQISMKVGESVWSEVDGWQYFEKDTIGKQLVRSVDSIAASISEGYGRYHYKEFKQYCYIARGSLYETKTWIHKAKKRELIGDEICDSIVKQLDELGIMLNNFIKTIGSKQNDK